MRCTSEAGRRAARRVVGWSLAWGLAACTVPPSVPYTLDQQTPLQDPMPGTAILYLLRSPYDGQDLTIVVDGRKVADLPKMKYTAITLKPGTHAVVATVKHVASADAPAAPPYALEAAADQRYFLVLPEAEVHTSTGIAGFMPMGKAGVMPIFVTRDVIDEGSQRWKLTNEEIAQWYLFYTRPVLPERDAL
ncbi:MAG: hypothetical protein JSR59_11980 [Proteobacteria bacterium]|nr:hypothetical protein [Pseudomonadota bacterium]